MTASCMNQQATQSDPELQQIKQIKHEDGWPHKKKSVPLAAQAYWPVRQTISIEDGLLLKDDCIIIPHALRPEVLKRLNVAHQGIQRSLAHARGSFYWPGLSNAIHIMIGSCGPCQTRAPENLSHSHPVPEVPWQKIVSDIFDFQGRPFLMIVDYSSKYPDVLQLPDKTRLSDS